MPSSRMAATAWEFDGRRSPAVAAIGIMKATIAALTDRALCDRPRD